MTTPLITLTTDFGTAGYYVAAMKGRILSRCPEVRLVDVTHEITPFEVIEASLILQETVKAFPPGTIHVAVVDPGVGGPRKPIVVQSHSQWFIGPDNGLFTPFLDGDAKVWELLIDRFAPVSRTFHGRDLFAPAAARLAAGEPVEEFARPMTQPVRMHLPRARREGAGVLGQVVYTDAFGNLVTTIRREDLAGFARPLTVLAGPTRVSRVVESYHQGAVGESLALIGSAGLLEIAVAQGNAALQLGIGRGERVRVEETRVE